MKRAIAVCMAAVVLCAFGDDPYVYEFAPEALEPHLRNASQSKLFWAADGVVSNGAVAYFRYKFELPSVPVDASLYYYFDDKGTVYLNGHPLLRPGSYAYQFLVAGANTIAIAMTNTVSSTAALFTLKCFDSRDESTRQAIAYVHSDASGKGTVDTPASGWEQPGFDDSAWPGVKILGSSTGVCTRPISTSARPATHTTKARSSGWRGMGSTSSSSTSLPRTSAEATGRTTSRASTRWYGGCLRSTRTHMWQSRRAS